MAKKIKVKQLISSSLATKHLLSASQMLELFAQDKTYNKTSVYRALDQLLAEGILCRHHFDDTEAVYELRSHHHAHLVCERCGTIATTECTYTQPQSVNGFVVDHHHLTLFGICSRCSSK